MAIFKNTSGEDREVSLDGTMRFVSAGDTFEVPDELAEPLRYQPHFTADADTLARWAAETAPAVTPDDPTTKSTKGGKN